jgi:hypothetical protein
MLTVRQPWVPTPYMSHTSKDMLDSACVQGLSQLAGMQAVLALVYSTVVTAAASSSLQQRVT